MAFFVGKLLARAPLARWRLALAVTQVLDIASLGVLFASVATMAVRSLSCGEECPVSPAVETVFTVSLLFSGMATCVYDLLRIIVARYEANEQKAVTLKSLGVIVIFQHLVPAACFFLQIVSTLLKLSSAKGSILEIISNVFMYVAGGVMALFSVVLFATMALFSVVLFATMALISVVLIAGMALIGVVLIAAMAAALCWLVALCAMTVLEFFLEFFSTVERKLRGKRSVKMGRQDLLFVDECCPC